MKYFFLIIFAAAACTGCGSNENENVIEATGTIEATYITLSAKTPGEILNIFSKEGSRVNKGDTLVAIDHKTLELQLKQAIAAREAVDAQLRLLKKGARKEDISQAEAQLKQININKEQAEKDLARMKNLLESKSITQKQFEDANARYESLSAQYQAAKENVDKLSNLARPEEIAQAEAKLNQAIANEELLRKNLNDSFIISPGDGFVVKQFFEEGESVAPGASLLRIADLDEMELIIYVSELELDKIKLGQKADVFIDAKKESYTGEVVYISPEAEFTPKNIQTKDERTKLVFEVKIEIPNPNYELKAGLPADAKININQ